ncbi:hypothetical protein CEE37_07680 [candidate division LCP-89 bacterium B3_LCP]|uniref:Uncharacterized protein n=1 Tax=candidate division LCP-89 bacterium B3_LCP TaxID=2012998 RepID=A0A532V0T9_UNCL8|nr:MAG: hypothetical protein CEE37_07680 [candidate division LCP-89 bacterium B3_LCP]
MNNTRLILLAVFVITSSGLATDISGPVSGTWDPSGNPYNLVGDTWIPAGETLTIMPGVDVDWVDTWTEFRAAGRLEVLGTPPMRVDMTVTPENYLHLVLEGSDIDTDSLVNFDLLGRISLSGSGHSICEMDQYCANIAGELSIVAISGENGSAENILVSSCEIRVYCATSYPVVSANAFAISNLGGIIETCVLQSFATNSNYSVGSMAYAFGLYECNTQIESNTIYSKSDNSPGGSPWFLASHASGIYKCTGLKENNFIYSWTLGTHRMPSGIYDYPINSGNVINNTIHLEGSSSSAVGIKNGGGTILNNIIYYEEWEGYGIEWDITNTIEVRYNTLWGFNEYFDPATPPTTDGNRIEDPQFDLITGFLLPTSHCINQGHPDPMYNDPDGSRNDRGWMPFDPGNGANLVASQNSLDFGLVTVGSYEEITVTFINLGQSSGEIETVGGFVPEFSLMSGVPSGLIAPGDSVQVTVRFTPGVQDSIYYDEMAFNGAAIPIYHLECIGEGVPSDLEIVLTPVSLPIVIPASGGSFDYNIEVSNLGLDTVTCDVWCNVLLPDGSLYGPLVGPASITVQPGSSLNRDRTQNVPTNAPAGTYTYQGWIGAHPTDPWDSDSFELEKLTTGDGELIDQWFCFGEPFDDVNWEYAPVIPAGQAIVKNHPNPFNPTTTINFALPEAGQVNLIVYDLSGRHVAELVNGWRDAGMHEVTFDGSGLASGMYIYRLKAGEFTASGKMMLLK